MVSDGGGECEKGGTTYCLAVETERHDMKLWTQGQRERDNLLSAGGEGA